MPQKVIIIGAGWSGVAAARTYLQINSSVDLTIIDSDSSFGGVWSASRIYPGIIVDSPRSTYEFSDMSMCDESHPLYGDITGEEVRDYFTRYADKWDLHRRARFNTHVVRVERRPGDRTGWIVVTSKGETIECDKLIVAAGTFTTPYTPDQPSVSDNFKGPVFHTRSLGTEYPRLQASDVNSVAVIGGQKSAIETLLLCLKAGKTAHWIIREEGNGAAPIILKATAASKWTPFALSKTKFFAQLCPSIYNRTGWWYKKLHSGASKLGFGFTKWFWSKVRPPNPDYNVNEHTRKIKPLIDSFFWSTTPPAFLKKESPFFDFLTEAKQLHVHRAEATMLSDDQLHLTNGDTISIDALVFATGWYRNQSSRFFSANDCISLGLPVRLTSQPSELATKWNRLDRDADEEVEALFPMIKDPPQKDPPAAENTPYRMYRHIVSPDLIAQKDRTITFLCIAGTAHTVTYAEISALWAVAWMEDLCNPVVEENDQVKRKNALEKEVALVNAFLRHRYLSSAKRPPAFLTEAQTVFDTLIRDMGLKVDRRKQDGGLQGNIREYLTPYECSDYSGMVEELLAKRKKVT